MSDFAEVQIWDQSVGVIQWDDKRKLGIFEYFPEFVKLNLELAPFKMPAKEKVRYEFPELRSRPGEPNIFMGLPGMIADALPDKYGNRLMDKWLAQQGRPSGSMNPVEKLLFIGSRGIGALTFEPRKEQGKELTANVELSSLIAVAQKVLSDRSNLKLNLRDDEEAAMEQLLRVGTSAGGARPKAVIAFNEKTMEVRSGQTRLLKGFEHWIIKLDGVDDAQFGSSHGWGRVEMAYYLMAKDCGIEMSECRLHEENGRAHFMTKRFDRDNKDRRKHLQTFCALKHYDYNAIGAFSYEQLFETMRELNLDYPSFEQMYKRMVFNVLATNFDDHTKNFSFIFDQKEGWRMSPAYDICYSYDPTNIWVDSHTITINGKQSNITETDLLRVAKTVGVKDKAAKTIIAQTLSIVRDWEKYAKEVGVDDARRADIQSNLIANKW